jgi:hypothetical protein
MSVKDKRPSDGLFIRWGSLQIGAYGKVAVILAAILVGMYLIKGFW